jgi:hypothetical protein
MQLVLPITLLRIIFVALGATSALEATQNAERVCHSVAKRGVSPAAFLRLGDPWNTVVANTVFVIVESAGEAFAVLQDNS